MREKNCFIALALLIIVYLPGCATVSQEQKEKWNETVPFCFTKSDCETKWAAARRWIQENAGWKIQIYSDDLIETHNPAPYDPKIAVSVSKNPIGTSTTGDKLNSINVKVWCANIFGCSPPTNEAILSFNKYVSSAQANDETCIKGLYKDDRPKIGLFGMWFKNNRFIIKSICVNSPAHKAGLQPNDIVHKIGNDVISSKQTWQESINKFNFDDKVSIEIFRNNIPQTYLVSLPSKEEVNLLRKPHTDPATTKSPEIEDKLESLQRLLNKGLITQEEFDMKKKQILSDF